MTSVRLAECRCANDRRGRVHSSLTILAVAACWTVGLTAVASGQEVVSIEEDWELVVGNPDTNSAGPQVTCTFSPDGDVTGLHAVLKINHRTLPSYTPGGLQLQLWNGETPVDSNDFPDHGLLRNTSECIHWTQRMRLENGQLTFEVVNGTSTSWNQFGGQGYLKQVSETTLGNLNQYKPSVSVNNSGIGYAANRVDSLVLKELRVYLANGEVLTDSTARVVHGN